MASAAASETAQFTFFIPIFGEFFHQGGNGNTEGSSTHSQGGMNSFPFSFLFTGSFPGFFPGVPINDPGFQELLNSMFQNFQPRGPPPASKSAVESLPVLSATTDHQSQECAVCQERYQVREALNQLPCSHLFHVECLKPWLTEHNTCPTCRWELETDDTDYEKGRAERMAKRQKVDCELSRRRECCIDESSTKKLACGHQFHTECFDVWSRIHNGSLACPCCGKDSSSSSHQAS